MTIDRVRDATVDFGRSTAVYFGLRDEEVPASTGLAAVRPSLLTSATWLGWSALIATAVVLGLFSWTPAAVVRETAVGIVVWGLLHYFVAVRRQLPIGALQTAPADAIWEPSRPEPLARVALWMILTVPACVGLGLVADWAEMGGAFLPGLPAGYLAACLFGAWRAHRWERRHRARLATRVHEGERQLWAVPAREVAPR